MAEWQRTIWRDIADIDGVVPHGGASVLVVGDGLPVHFADDVRVTKRLFGEAMGEDAGFHRILILADGDALADFALLLTQMWRLLRPDGLLVVVAARPSPWGLRGTAWWRGYPLKIWLRWLKQAHWILADELTVGFHAFWARWVLIGGPVRVILAQKRVGGAKMLTTTKEGKVVAKPVGMPV